MNPESDGPRVFEDLGDLVKLRGYRVSMEWGGGESNGVPPSAELRRQVFCGECITWYDFAFSPHPDHEAP